MRAWQIQNIRPITNGEDVLVQVELGTLHPRAGEVLIAVHACGICHTELDEIEGRTPPPILPVIPGHQIVGEVVGLGEGVAESRLGQRVGVAWIYYSCGHCVHCLSGCDNLCPDFLATGRDVNGGYAEQMCVPERYAYPLPASLVGIEAAPLLCAGAVGYRSLRLANPRRGMIFGLSGFGASGHIVLKMIRHRHPDSKVFVFARSGVQRDFAMELGATWTGSIGELAPQTMDAIIDTTPAWKPVVEAMTQLSPGGRLVINAIRKEDSDKDSLLQLDYAKHLWEEKEIKSVANVTPQDVVEFLELAEEMDLRPEVQVYPFDQANQAIHDLRRGNSRGAKVLEVAKG